MLVVSYRPLASVSSISEVKYDLRIEIFILVSMCILPLTVFDGLWGYGSIQIASEALLQVELKSFKSSHLLQPDHSDECLQGRLLCQTWGSSWPNCCQSAQAKWQERVVTRAAASSVGTCELVVLSMPQYCLKCSVFPPETYYQNDVVLLF